MAFSADTNFWPIHYLMLFRAKNHECVVDIAVCLVRIWCHMPLSRTPFTVLLFISYLSMLIWMNFELVCGRIVFRFPKTCPVAITERLFQMLSDHPDSCNPVVRRIKSRGISYTTAKDMIKKKLGIFFDDLRKLGTHSLRS